MLSTLQHLQHLFAVIGLIVSVRPCDGNITAVERSEYRQQGVRMVSDVLQSEHIPTNVLMATCWSPTENVFASRSLLYPVSFVQKLDDGHFRIADAVKRNVVLIVVDLDCGWKQGWLAVVRFSVALINDTTKIFKTIHVRTYGYVPTSCTHNPKTVKIHDTLTIPEFGFRIQMKSASIRSMKFDNRDITCIE